MGDGTIDELLVLTIGVFLDDELTLADCDKQLLCVTGDGTIDD